MENREGWSREIIYVWKNKYKRKQSYENEEGGKRGI